MNTSEKITEIKNWVLNDEGLYLDAKELNKLIQKGVFETNELNYMIERFMYSIVEKSNIFVKPSEIEAMENALLKIIKEID